jgi:prepilin-type N-terminal cleavage/methylation domain-containing protein
MLYRGKRRGFTLVEMLVATALIMFIMLILSEAFSQGLNAFRVLKGIGDMEARLRSAVTTIRNDLVADHFEGRRRLSDPSFWQQGNPREGYFSLSQGGTPTVGFAPGGGIAAGSTTATIVVPSLVTSGGNIQPSTVLVIDSGGLQDLVQVASVNPGPPPTVTVFPVNLPTPQNPLGLFANSHGPQFLVRVTEGKDADFLPSMRATDHVLAMTVKARGNRIEDFFAANLPYNPPTVTSPFFPIIWNGTPGGAQNPYYAPTNFFNQASDSRYQDFLPTTNATELYKSQWAEVGYFMVPNGTAANGTPLFALFRCQFVVAPDTRNLNVPPTNPPTTPPSPPIPFTSWAADGYADMSCEQLTNTGNGQTYYYFNNPSDLANISVTGTPNPIAQGPQTVNPLQMSGVNQTTGMAWSIRPGSTLLVDSGLAAETVAVINATQTSFTAVFQNPHPNGAAIGILTRAFASATTNILRGQFDPVNPQLWSATLLLTDVVSFDVRILAGLPGYNTDFGDIIPVPGWPTKVFDTALPFSPMSPPYPIKAIQITLRVWDMKTQQARQITMIQDM